jgi:hypothetical protein
MSPTVYPRVGFLGRFGWGGSDLATGSLQNTHATTRMSPRKKLGRFIICGVLIHSFLDEATNDVTTTGKTSGFFK